MRKNDNIRRLTQNEFMEWLETNHDVMKSFRKMFRTELWEGANAQGIQRRPSLDSFVV